MGNSETVYGRENQQNFEQEHLKYAVYVCMCVVEVGEHACAHKLHTHTELDQCVCIYEHQREFMTSNEQCWNASQGYLYIYRFG